MPTLSRWFLRAALLHLIAALLLNLSRVLPGLPDATRAALAPVGVHLLMVGWVTQMIVGVGYWMFPRAGRSLGPPWVGWTAFVGLNAGVLLRAVAEPAVSLGVTGPLRALLVVAAVLQLAALLHFLVGATLGAWMLAAKAGGPASPPWSFPVHVEVLLYGWLLQLVLGVAHWILPRPAGEGRARDSALVWTAAASLNIGVSVVVAAAVLGVSVELPGRLLELAGAALAAGHLVPRVRAYRVTG